MLIKEQTIGLFFSIALHVGLVALVFLSVNPEPIKPPQGISIQAEIIDVSQLKNPPPKNNKPAPKKTAPKKPEPKKPEPKKPEPKKQPPPEPKIKKPEPKPVVKKPEPKPVVKKPKIDHKKRQEKSERQKKLEALRKKRLAAEQKKPEPVKETPEATSDEPAEAQPVVGTQKGKPNQETQLLNQYIGSIQAAVTRQWARPASTPKGLTCRIKVSQIPGGGVIDVSISTPCNASSVVKNSIINAVKKADPLPYQGFEKVFDRRLQFTFQYQGD